MYVQLDARPIEEGCGKIVCSWKSSELESAEPCEEKHQKPRPQPNSVFAQFSIVCMFNWMFGQLRKAIERSYIRKRTPNLNRLSSAREFETSLSAQFSVRVILSRIYVQLDARLIEEGYGKVVCCGRAPNLDRLSRARKERSRPQPNLVFAQFSVVCMFNWMLGQLRKGCGKVVYSWKSSEFESAEQCEGKCHKPSPSAQFSVRAIPSRVYVQLDARPIEEGCRKVVS